MDTVYQRGMAASQPYRVEGDRAYGLGIADDKSGVALAIHAVSVLQALGQRQYGTLTVLINGDEEISSPGSRNLITKLGSEHDAVFSCEGAGNDDRIRLTTSGNGSVLLKVQGRASHAGAAPDDGRNALYELAHHILQTRDLSEPLHRHVAELDDCQRRRHAQHHPRLGVGHRRCPRHPRARLGHARSQAPRAARQDARPRHQGDPRRRAPPSTAGGDRRFPRALRTTPPRFTA